MKFTAHFFMLTVRNNILSTKAFLLSGTVYLTQSEISVKLLNDQLTL